MCIAARPFFRPEAAANYRLHAKRIEIVRGNKSTGRAFRPITDTQRCARNPINDERLEKCGIFLKIDKIGIGKSAPFRAAGRASQREHSPLMRDERVGANQNSLDPTEHRRVGADAERQTKNCKNGKSRATPKHSRAEPQVLPKLVRPHPDSLFACNLLDLFDAAELSHRGGARRFGRHAGGDVPFGQTIKMLLYLLRHVCIAALLLKEPEQATKPGVKS